MILVFFRRLFSVAASTNPRIFTCPNRYCSSALSSIDNSDEAAEDLVPSGNVELKLVDHVRGAYNSPWFWHNQPQLDSRRIKVVDSDTWRISSLAHASRGIEHELGLRSFDVEAVGYGTSNNPRCAVDDFDEIEDMRMHGNLFYKIDRGSKEFEEYAFEFHRRKSSSIKNDKRENKSRENSSSDSVAKVQKPLKGKVGQQAYVNEERLVRTIKEKYIVCTPNEIDSCHVKKQRNPTFNQLTGPYHEPFCLDIYVSKGSVRACVVHRATSKVVVVAHSISKDMKFDIGSPKSATAAAAVGKILAQRALADDVHDVIFTPRKGDKLEGKLQIVLESIIDNGVNVKVKIKQRNPNKAVSKSSTNNQISS